MASGADTVAGRRGSVRVGALRVFSILNGLILLGVLVQGMTGGAFLGGATGVNWAQLHQVNAGVVETLALVAAILAIATQRRRRGIAVWSPVLFALLILQHGLGAGISGGNRVLVAVHVPVALLVVGVGVYLSVAAARARWSLSSGS
jgi:heme A synthase